ncbi:MAG TPA: DUF1453 domain-containing protein [Verrucomicrobiae bacterium]
MPLNSNSVAPVAITAIFAWRIYNRVRKNIGRQALQPKGLIARVVMFSIVAAGMIAFSIIYLPLLPGTLGGLVLGVLLAAAGLRLTRFESTPAGRFYTPNPYFGSGLSVLLVVRVACRLFVLSNQTSDSPQTPGLLQSPLSMCVLGLLAGYYIAYSIGVLKRGRVAAAI